MPKDPNKQNNNENNIENNENHGIKQDSQSVQNDNTANLYVQIPLDPYYDLKKIINPEKYDLEENAEQNGIQEAELIDFEKDPDVAEKNTGYEKATYQSLSAIQQLVFRARYVIINGGDLSCLENENIWDDPKAEELVHNIANDDDALCNELEGYYLSKCKPTDNSLTEQEIKDNKEFNLSLLYNVASILSVKPNEKRSEDDIMHRLNELENIIGTNTKYKFSADQTFDFLDSVFEPSAAVNHSTLNTKLLGKHSEIKNNNFIPTEDIELANNKKLIGDIKLSDLKEQTNLSKETVEAIVAGCFFRPDVLGSTYDQTFSDLENSINPIQKNKNFKLDKFDTMVDTFFTYTAGGDNRRSANLSLLAVPKARQMARFALGNLTQLSDKRAVVESLENVIRVAGKYAMMHTTNDHALYAASKLVNDAMIALDMPQFREISTLSAQERNMARGVSNLYLANVDLIKLNYELHDALIDHRAHDILKGNSEAGKKPIENEDVKRVFDSIYVRRHYIESHLKMAAQYGDKMRPLTSEELTCALNPAKYFDSLIKSNNVVVTPHDVSAAENVEEFNKAFKDFNDAPISNSGINTISSADYNKKLAGAVLSFSENADLMYCADRSNALTKFYSQLEKGLRPISSDLLSLYEIQKQRESINSLRSYLKIESPYSTPFAQVILGSLLQDKSNRNPDIKNIKPPYKLEHFSPIARQYLFDGPQPGNLKRIKNAVNQFTATLNELDQMLASVEWSREHETDFIKDCLKDPDKPLGPDIEAQFKKKGIDGVAKSAMISKSYKAGQSLGLSELLIHLQENYKSTPKSLIVKRSLADIKKNTAKNTGSDTASRSTRQSRQSKAVQSIRSFVSTRSDMSSVSRADNSYSISIEDLEVLQDDLSVDNTVKNNEKIAQEVAQLKDAKKPEKKKKHVKKGPSTNWGAKLDPNAEKEPSQLDVLSDLSKDTSVKTLNLSSEEQEKLHKETLRKKLELDTEKVRKGVEAKYSNVKNDTGLSLISEEDEDQYENEEFDEVSENKIESKLDPRIIDVGVLDAEFDSEELLNTILPANEENVQKEQPQVNKEYKMPQALNSFSRTTELIRPIDGALETINQCLNGEQLIEEEKLAIDSIRPLLEKTQKYYAEFRDQILSGSDGLSYLYDESGKPTPQFVTMEICRRLYKNELQLPQKDSGVQADYKSLVDTVAGDLTEKYKQYKDSDRILSYNDILLAPTSPGKLNEAEVIEEAFEKTKALALDPEKIKKLKDIPNPGIQYIVNNAETLYGKLKNTKFADIELDLVDQTGYSFVPRLDYITMRLFSSINSNYDKYAANPNLFNINQEIEKLENELGDLKQNGEVFQVTQENFHYMFGVENPEESKVRRTDEKFALKDQAVKIKETLTKALALGGTHYQKLVRDGITSLDNFISEFAEFSQNRITPTLSNGLTRIQILKANASRGERRIRHAHDYLTNIQTAIDVVNKVVKERDFSLYDFENAKAAGEERRSIELNIINKIDQVSNQGEDFAIKLYSDMFNSMPKNVDKYIESLGKGIIEKKEFLKHKAELEEQQRIAEEQAKEQARIAAEEKAEKEFNDFRDKFDKNVVEHKEEMLARLKAQKYICDEIIERLDDHSLVGPTTDLRTLASNISKNCDTIISNINNNVSVFDSFVNKGDRTVNNDYALRRIFRNVVAVGINDDINVQYNNETVAGQKLNSLDHSLASLAADYRKQNFDSNFFSKNVTPLGDLKIDTVNKIIEVRERKVYERSPEYQEKVQNDKRIEALLSNKSGGEDLIADLTLLKSAFDQFTQINNGNNSGAGLVQKASEALDKVIADVKNNKPLFTSLVDKDGSRLSPDGAALVTALEVYGINKNTDVPSIVVNAEGLEKHRAKLTGVFDVNKLSTAVPKPEQFAKMLQPDPIREYNQKAKEVRLAKEALENRLKSPLQSEEDVDDFLRNVILDNGVDIVNNLVIQKIALDKVLSKANENNYSQAQKDLAKLGSEACVDLIRKITNDPNFVEHVVSNDDGKLKFSDDLSVLAYCKKAFNIKKGDISGNEQFDENEIKGKSAEELKNTAKQNIAGSMEQAPSYKDIEKVLKDNSLQSGFVDADMDTINAARFDIDDVDYYKIISGVQIEDEQLDIGGVPHAYDLAAEKRQIKTLKFGAASKDRFAEAFTGMRNDLKKQDAWYHKNSDEYKNILKKLDETITRMKGVNGASEKDILKNYTELNSVCEIYLNKNRSSKFYTDWGRNRFKQITEIQEIASARIESVHIEQYKQTIAENITKYLFEKTNHVQPTPQQLAEQVAIVKKNPIYNAVIQNEGQDKGLEELQRLARDPQTLISSVKKASVEFAKENGMLEIKNTKKEDVLPQLL